MQIKLTFKCGKRESVTLTQFIEMDKAIKIHAVAIDKHERY